MNKFMTKSAVIILGGILMIYAAIRGVNFITQTLTAGEAIAAYFFLGATEIGAILWLVYFLKGAEGGGQRSVALVMTVIDLIGSAALYGADALMGAGEKGITTKLLPAEIRTLILSMSGLIFLNIAATFAAHILDPEARKAAAKQDVKDKIADATYKQLDEQSESIAEQIAPDVAVALQAEIIGDIQRFFALKRQLPASKSEPANPAQVRGASASPILDRRPLSSPAPMGANGNGNEKRTFNLDVPPVDLVSDESNWHGEIVLDGKTYWGVRPDFERVMLASGQPYQPCLIIVKDEKRSLDPFSADYRKVWEAAMGQPLPLAVGAKKPS